MRMRYDAAFSLLNGRNALMRRVRREEERQGSTAAAAPRDEAYVRADGTRVQPVRGGIDELAEFLRSTQQRPGDE